MSFESLGLDPWVSSVMQTLKIDSPTEIQKQCIPAILNKKHVVGAAVTGSGKTAAFALPILQGISEEMYGVFALVLTPSRELAYQIVDQFVAFGAPIGARTAVVIGGAPHGRQVDVLKGRPHVVVATPGRLKFLLETFPEVNQAFKNLRFAVFDEADRLLEGDLRLATLDVVDLLGQPKPFRRTLLFTATLSSNLVNLDEGDLPKLGVKNSTDVIVAGNEDEATANEGNSGIKDRLVAPNLTQRYLFVPVVVKMPYLVALLRSQPIGQSCIIFTNSCFRCEIVRLTLQLLGFPVTSLNSILTQKQRLNNLAEFKLGLAKFLVATDIAARGLDIPQVDLVVHYDFPKLSAQYVHRVGRTARAGRWGSAVAMVTDADIYLVHKLERRIGAKLKTFKHHSTSQDAVLEILDTVSNAKVEAKLTIRRLYGDKALRLKEVGEERRADLNRAIREDGRAGVLLGRKRPREE